MHDLPLLAPAQPFLDLAHVSGMEGPRQLHHPGPGYPGYGPGMSALPEVVLDGRLAVRAGGRDLQRGLPAVRVVEDGIDSPLPAVTVVRLNGDSEHGPSDSEGQPLVIAVRGHHARLPPYPPVSGMFPSPSGIPAAISMILLQRG